MLANMIIGYYVYISYSHIPLLSTLYSLRTPGETIALRFYAAIIYPFLKELLLLISLSLSLFLSPSPLSLYSFSFISHEKKAHTRVDNTFHAYFMSENETLRVSLVRSLLLLLPLLLLC
jgi:hypothetical protein